MHPKVAYRSCDSCRKFQYDENDGELVIGRDDQPMKRLGKVPCDSSVGCANGHYNNLKLKPLTASEEGLLELYHASKATGGRVLSEGERNDSAIAVLFSQLERIYKARETHDLAVTIARVLAQTRGP